MSELEKVAKRGPKRKLTDSERKRRKRDSNLRLNKNRVYLGDQYDRWTELKATLRLETNAEVAKLLLDRYQSSEMEFSCSYSVKSEEAVSVPKRQKVCTSTPGPLIQKFPLLTDVSEISSSEQEYGCGGIISGVEEMSAITVEKTKTCFKASESSFINPFDLTITKSEKNYEERDDSSDEDYEPSFDLTLREDHGFNVEIDKEEDTDDDTDIADLPEIPLGPGIKRIKNDADVDGLLEDNPYLVFRGPLIELAMTFIPSTCKDCGTQISITTETVSSAIYLKWICQNNHTAHKWCSQPILNRRLHSGDLLFSAALLMSGNNFHKISLFSKFLKLPILSSSTFFKIQRSYLVPSIDKFWLSHQEAVLQEFRDKDVVLLGDGRMDSPGHSAQYCSYTFMENETKKVLCLITMDKRMTERKSTNLEKACFIKGLTFLLGKNIRVVEVVTDAHVQIEAVMKKDYPGIKHSFDIWHGAKNLGKKILKAGQEKQNKALLDWTRDVVNHYWYCADVSTSVDEFLGIWFGMVQHVTNEHSWILSYTDSGANECRHGPLLTPRDKGWLKPGSPPHVALREIVMNKRLIQKIPYYLNCRTTSELENFQNLILKYASKRNAYKPPTYRARNLLAALDNNVNCNRSDLTNKDGSTRYQRYYSKKGGRWSAYSVKQDKTYNHVFNIIELIVKTRLEDRVGMNSGLILEPTDPRRISCVLAPIPPPNTSDIVDEQKSRKNREDPDKTVSYNWQNNDN